MSPSEVGSSILSLSDVISDRISGGVSLACSSSLFKALDDDSYYTSQISDPEEEWPFQIAESNLKLVLLKDATNSVRFAEIISDGASNNPVTLVQPAYGHTAPKVMRKMRNHVTRRLSASGVILRRSELPMSLTKWQTLTWSPPSSGHIRYPTQPSYEEQEGDCESTRDRVSNIVGN